MGHKGNLPRTIPGQLGALNQRLLEIEARFAELGYDTKRMVVSEVKKRWKIVPQAETYFGVYLGLCVDTIDPLKQGRVRFYSPEMNHEKTQIEQCEWAWPISAMGGFDDCGLVWVPPAGSLLCIIFGRGSRRYPYYMGTTWGRNRDPDGQHNFQYNVEEFYKIHEGHRKGYLLPPNDGSQCLPQWNTENYNGIDANKERLMDDDAIAKRKVTYPHIYGFKTPQKHYVKLDDGNYKCGHRYKRIEIGSSLNNWMIFKDDFLHPMGQWAHPECSCGGGDESECMKEVKDANGNSNWVPKENPGDCLDPKSKPKCANPYFKHQNECAPYKGPGTPQNNKACLHQSGIQFLSRSGATIIFDDTVEQPRVPGDGLAWEVGLGSFDFGCTDKCQTKVKIISPTGHRFEMLDEEDDTNNRGPKNLIRLVSACGNTVELNDHTVDKKLSGAKRGITLRSTSNHKFEMLDEEDEQHSPDRQEINKPQDEGSEIIDPESRPIPKAKKAYCRLRTGYGLEMRFNDDNSQEECQQQYIQIFSPQCGVKGACNPCGPHILRFQESPSAGYVFLRVGGTYIISVCDDMYTIVGAEDHPADWITVVNGTSYHQSTEYYINKARLHLFLADSLIILDAGQDCENEDGTRSGCLTPVIVMGQDGYLHISDRVYATTSPGSSRVQRPMIENDLI